jgi:hypothetical protein
MTLNCQHLVTLHRIPEFDRPVAATTRDQLTVRAEGNAFNAVTVATQYQDLAATGTCPYLDRLVRARTREPRPIGTEGDAMNRT